MEKPEVTKFKIQLIVVSNIAMILSNNKCIDENQIK